MMKVSDQCCADYKANAGQELKLSFCIIRGMYTQGGAFNLHTHTHTHTVAYACTLALIQHGHLSSTFVTAAWKRLEPVH